MTSKWDNTGQIWDMSQVVPDASGRVTWDEPGHFQDSLIPHFGVAPGQTGTSSFRGCPVVPAAERRVLDEADNRNSSHPMISTWNAGPSHGHPVAGARSPNASVGEAK